MPRPRKPEAQKKLAGTDRPYRKREEAAFRLVSNNEPHPELMGPEAVGLWQTMTEELRRVNLFTVTDTPALVAYCNLYQSMVHKWREGESPNVNVLAQFRQLANEFGATPASRSKPVPVEEDKQNKNPFAKYA